MNPWWTVDEPLIPVCYRCATGNPVGVDERVEECWDQNARTLPYLAWRAMETDGDYPCFKYHKVTVVMHTHMLSFVWWIYVGKSGKCNKRTWTSSRLLTIIIFILIYIYIQHIYIYIHIYIYVSQTRSSKARRICINCVLEEPIRPAEEVLVSSVLFFCRQDWIQWHVCWYTWGSETCAIEVIDSKAYEIEGPSLEQCGDSMIEIDIFGNWIHQDIESRCVAWALLYGTGIVHYWGFAAESQTIGKVDGHLQARSREDSPIRSLSWDDIWTTERLHWIDLVIWPQQYLILFSSAFTCIHIIHICFQYVSIAFRRPGISWSWAAAPRSRPRWTDHGYRKCRSGSRAHWQSCSAEKSTCDPRLVCEWLHKGIFWLG